MILVIDNYDSFVNNLARYFRLWSQETIVVRNDAIDLESIRELDPDAIVLSPGPCTPDEAGVSLEVVREFVCTTPMLGVCLGHQTIAQALGGKVVRSFEPMHGRASIIRHDHDPLFAGMPDSIRVGRYHSLIVEQKTLPTCLRTIAAAEDRSIMAFRHLTRPVYGVQFHPESILTEQGFAMIGNFLKTVEIEARMRSNVPSDAAPSTPPDQFSTDVPFYY
ncbi:aminodeoxychorismate/anthranilate synthase component II [Blastopirellula sp. JC732]|uniref:Aminodeoxychorismate/anthranilate synthase component II n=1 Tax=Blastopirellula sediminis TaxID=2894196 RepID=A0A9X1MI96_9BACT|nr:aminodeoxychorismate/anthranilate synthase component II [Blastopirellula sediminis]MCC9608146.1 aminodeoxychorismate/anthranilate synthase component II [Blastopirellula sediminis]MCC9627061.1 aminodeoxychorismate/anthranilate synthase component II [Blastopirellula sediminis]